VANKKRNKYPNQSKVLADARRYVIKKGEYNGAEDSSEFLVSGHSSGSPYSEMEELSKQVTRDAGGYDYREPEFANDQGETGYEMYQGQGVGDLGGPELYGDHFTPRTSTSRGLAIGAAVGLAATALLGGLAYLVYQKEKQPRRKAHAGSTRSHAPHAHAKSRAKTASASRSKSRAPSEARPSSQSRRSPKRTSQSARA